MSTPAFEISELIHPDTFSRASKFAAGFASARPFRHVVIDNFLTPEYCQALVTEFPEFDERLAINEDGVVGAKAVREQIRDISPAYKALDELSKSESFIKLVGAITGIDDLHHDPYYFGGGTHENRNGQGLDAHVDFNYHPITREHRRLNLIVYLNPEWQDAWGGSLQLHRDPYLPPSQDEIHIITPLLNRCVIFETNEYSWHGFPRIQLPADKQELSRRSFALYYYTRERPADETANEHSTIYVNEHLPEWYYAGMQLDAEQLQHIRNLVAVRNQHLKRLYGHIKDLNGQIHGLRHQLESRTSPVADDMAGAAAPNGEESINDQTRILQMQLHQLNQRVRDMERSTSWRLTAPMRAVKRMFLRG